MILAAGCSGRTPPGPQPAESPGPHIALGPVPGPPTEPWRLELADGAVGFDGERMFVWEGSGIAEHSVRDGSRLRTRKIAGIDERSAPELWQAVPGGWLTGWGAPTFIRDVDGALEFGWTAPGDDWIGDITATGDSVLAAESRIRASLVNLAIADGRMLWWARLPADLGLDAIHHDDSLVYVVLHVRDDHGPTSREPIPLRVAAFDRSTGDARWTVDFDSRFTEVTAARGVVVAAVHRELRFIEGASGRVLRRILTGAPSRAVFHVVGDRVIVGLISARSSVSSYVLATGAHQWTTELAISHEMTSLGDAVFVTTPSRSVAALDLHSGAVRWIVGTGIHAYGIHASEAAVVVNAPHAAGGFALPVTGADEQATIRGRVLEVECGSMDLANLHIGDTRVQVAADGTFAATIRARGLVFVRGVGSGRRVTDPAQQPNALVRLDGSGSYTVPDLTLGRCDYE